MTFWQKLDALLRRRYWTRADLMAALGKPGANSTASNWYKKKSLPNAITCLKIARLLGVTVDYLLDDSIADIYESQTEMRRKLELVIEEIGETEALRRILDKQEVIYLPTGDFQRESRRETDTERSIESSTRSRSAIGHD